MLRLSISGIRKDGMRRNGEETMKRTMLYVILGTAILAAVVGVIVWWSLTAQVVEQETRFAVVERGTMHVAVSASGSVEPQTRVSLAFETPGRVDEVLVEVGDRVETGDVLVRLDSEEMALQVEQSQAALASTEAQLAQLCAGPQPEEVAAAEANLRAAQAQVGVAAANRDQLESGASDARIAAAEADLAAAISEQKVAEDTHDKTLKCKTFPAGKVFSLPNGKVITLTEEIEICPALGVPEEQARYRLHAADNTLAATRARLDELLAGADADEIRAASSNVWAAAARRDAAQAQLDLLLDGATDEQIAVAEARVAQAQAALEQAELSLEHATLRAPFDGVVAQVDITAGEMASTGLSPVALVDTSKFRVTVSVDEIDVGQLAEGQTAEVTLDALPGTVTTGTVERIAPAATLEGGVVYYDVIIELAPTDAPIRADMTANAMILIEELTDVLMIPTWVVRVDRRTGQTYVHRQVGAAGGVAGEVERVDVALGVRHEGVAQVLSGLSEGDRVVWVQDAAPFGFEHS
jgi:HlyD family secretion protein